MSQRFIRCRHCGFPHDGSQIVCPKTGLTIRGKSRGLSEPLPAARPIALLPPPSRPSPRGLLGKTVGGKYLIRSVLGEGGMGTVFEAEHISLGRSVAVKVLHATQAAKKSAVRRFQQEARAAGAIGHPNICGVVDVGTLDNGSPYMVMERLVGETLADRIASEGGLPFEDVIDVLVQVLSGLVAAHEQRIVHRDIKPENVFLTQRVGCAPLVKLLDFGVSKMMRGAQGGPSEDDLSLTRTGMVMGTPYYMAPEQARGERDVDARVDLYACGVIMYESLTGRRPFTAANYNALLVQIVSAAPRSPCELRPALPPAYAGVIAKAMARRREDRYADASDFQRDLLALRDRRNTPVRGLAPSGNERTQAETSPWLPPAAEPPSGSVEIPVTVTGEDEAFGVEPTTAIHSRPPEPPSPHDQQSNEPNQSDEGNGNETHENVAQVEMDDVEGDDGAPTQLMAHPKPLSP